MARSFLGRAGPAAEVKRGYRVPVARPFSSPSGLPRHLTRLDLKVTAAGALALRLHAANRVTWFLGESDVATPQLTIELLTAWASEPREPLDATAWHRRPGVQLPVPAEAWAPILWNPPPELEDQFTAAFATRRPAPDAARDFGAALARELSDFFTRSQDAARAHLAEGWLDAAQARLEELRRIVDPSQQRSAGSLAAQLGGELRAIGFMTLAPQQRARLLYDDLQAERSSLYGWEQALARLGISAPRGSGQYP